MRHPLQWRRKNKRKQENSRCSQSHDRRKHSGVVLTVAWCRSAVSKSSAVAQNILLPPVGPVTTFLSLCDVCATTQGVELCLLRMETTLIPSNTSLCLRLSRSSDGPLTPSTLRWLAYCSYSAKQKRGSFPPVQPLVADDSLSQALWAYTVNPQVSGLCWIKIRAEHWGKARTRIAYFCKHSPVFETSL